jgi:eukaryotic-like serine/threonine-protein kinase
MDPEHWRRIEQLYHSALELESEQRIAFLAEACEGDENLRRQVDVLLSQSDSTKGVVASRVWEAIAEQAEKSGALAAGTRLGPYQILGPLGEGGMGKVYRGVDTRLDRPVAIKICGERFSERFDREARAISSLNHPLICTLYDVGANYLVMELVEGETLAQRIARASQLPLQEVLDIGSQIAEALEAAHHQGIIHRDVKPANVKITPEGTVKVLDFGLAKSIRNYQLDDDVPRSQGLPSNESVAGQVLGTPAYMSPEQARGVAVDSRTDVWALGCVLYELLTGKRAFPGESNSATIAAILDAEPDWQALPPKTPGPIRDLLRMCLEKNTQRRPFDMTHVRSCIENTARSRISRRWPVRTSLVIALIVTAGGGVTAWELWDRRNSNAGELLHPIPLTSYLGTQQQPSFSPDGEQVAFSWDGEKQDNFDIYTKRIGPGPPLRLTNNALPDRSPVWSPDGSSIAFLREVRNKTTYRVVLIPAHGGPERIIGDNAYAPLSAPGQTLAWSPDGKWLASFDRPKGQAGGLWLISVETGERHRLTTVTDPERADDGPAFSPEGNSLAFIRRVRGGEADLYLLPLGHDQKPRGEPRRLTQENHQLIKPCWTADGRELIYAAGVGGQEELWRLALSDGARPRRLTAQNEVMALTLSGRSRRLVFAQSRREMDIYRVELGARGGEAHGAVPLIASSRHDRYPRYSPDGKKISFISLRSGNWQLWVCDSDGANLVPLTSFERGEVRSPEWSNDSGKIVFKSNSEGSFQYYTIDLREGLPHKIEPSAGPDRASFAKTSEVAISPDGRFRYFGLHGRIWRQPVDGGTDSAREVFSFEGIINDSGLALDRWGIYFVANPSVTSPGEMMFYRFPNGPVSKMTGVDSPSLYGSSVSPDGRYLLYTRFTATGSDLMLVDNFR